jgi:hypothetical protein
LRVWPGESPVCRLRYTPLSPSRTRPQGRCRPQLHLRPTGTVQGMQACTKSAFCLLLLLSSACSVPACACIPYTPYISLALPPCPMFSGQCRGSTCPGCCQRDTGGIYSDSPHGLKPNGFSQSPASYTGMRQKPQADGGSHNRLHHDDMSSGTSGNETPAQVSLSGHIRSAGTSCSCRIPLARRLASRLAPPCR